MLVMGAPFGFGVREKKSKRVKGRFHKETEGVLVGIFWLLFWANRKRNALAAAENIILVYPTRDEVAKHQQKNQHQKIFSRLTPSFVSNCLTISLTVLSEARYDG